MAISIPVWHVLSIPVWHGTVHTCGAWYCPYLCGMYCPYLSGMVLPIPVPHGTVHTYLVLYCPYMFGAVLSIPLWHCIVHTCQAWYCPYLCNSIAVLVKHCPVCLCVTCNISVIWPGHFKCFCHIYMLWWSTNVNSLFVTRCWQYLGDIIELFIMMMLPVLPQHWSIGCLLLTLLRPSAPHDCQRCFDWCYAQSSITCMCYMPNIMDDSLSFANTVKCEQSEV